MIENNDLQGGDEEGEVEKTTSAAVRGSRKAVTTGVNRKKNIHILFVQISDADTSSNSIFH